MKKVFLSLCLSGVMAGINIQAQNSGVVEYEQTMKLEIKLEGDAAQFADMLPRERKSKKELIFNEKASIYSNPLYAGENEVINESSGRANIMIRAGVDNDVIYNDLVKNKRIEQREFFTRNFLIESDDVSNKWKLTGNRKEILGYECLEAETSHNEGNVKAWFAPLIQSSAGPGIFTGLPGLILEIESNEGKNVIKAISIDIKLISDKEIKKPNKGKKVTPEEFKKIVDEKMAEMGVTPGGGNRPMVIIRHQ